MLSAVAVSNIAVALSNEYQVSCGNFGVTDLNFRFRYCKCEPFRHRKGRTMEQPNQTRTGRDIAISWPEIIRWAKKQSSTACLRMAQKIERIATHYHIAEALDDLVACAAQNPLIALFIIAVIASCGLPVLIFLLFVIISFLITFTGFVFIEGTILAIGSALLCAFIFSALTTLAVTASVIALMYLGLNEAYDYLQTNLSNIQHSEANIQDARVTSNEERN